MFGRPAKKPPTSAMQSGSSVRLCPRLVPLVLSWAICGAAAELANPLGKVLDLLDELQGKITKDGSAEALAYHEYFEWCDETSTNGQFSIKSATTRKGKLEAKIVEHSSDISVASDKIEELAAAISSAQSELKDASKQSKKVSADFVANEAELMQASDAVGRAITILSKEMAKHPASFAQLDTNNMGKALQALSVVLDAAAFSSNDHKSLLALVQSQQSEDADDEDLDAPAAATYKTQSSGILDVLVDMREKAESKLGDLRKAEVSRQHNFDMLRESLTAQAKADTEDMEEERAGKAASEEALAAAQGDLEMTVKALESANKQLSTCHSSCLQVAADHEATVAARQQELTTLAKAKTLLQETSSGAVSQTYSLFQVTSASALGLQQRTRADLVGSVVVAVKRLAKQQHSPMLSQLAKRIAVMRLGADPFWKVKGLIQNMVARLAKEADEDATEKAFCDEQLAKTEAKKGDLEDEIAKQTSRIDQSVAKSAQLKEDVKELETQLAALAKEQAEMDKIRQESHTDFVTAKADLELGLSGVRKALDTLQAYYGGDPAMLQEDLGAFMQQPAVPEKHTKAAGAGGGIIDMLQMIEDDFATNLAKEEAEEEDAQAEYEKITQENKVTKTLREQDVKYKVKETKSLETTVTEYSADRQKANTELTAVLEYFAQMKDRCIAKPIEYEARVERRTAEIDGLKKALKLLDSEVALVQRKRKQSFRGSLAAN